MDIKNNLETDLSFKVNHLGYLVFQINLGEKYLQMILSQLAIPVTKLRPISTYGKKRISCRLKSQVY